MASIHTTEKGNNELKNIKDENRKLLRILGRRRDDRALKIILSLGKSFNPRKRRFTYVTAYLMNHSSLGPDEIDELILQAKGLGYIVVK